MVIHAKRAVPPPRVEPSGVEPSGVEPPRLDLPELDLPELDPPRRGRGALIVLGLFALLSLQACNMIFGVDEPLPLDGSGGGAVTLGTGGAPLNGSGGSGQGLGSGGVQVGSGGVVGSGGTGAQVGSGGGAGTGGGNQSGGECESEGEIVCAGTASIARLICQDGYWSMHEPCEGGQLCAPSGAMRGTCQFIPADCVGRAPNESFCDGVTRKTCSQDLLNVLSEQCPTIQHCTLGSGSRCAACLPDTFECDGEVLMTCMADGSGYAELDCAAEGKPCSETAGACTESVCSEGQKRCGSGDMLEICSDELSGFIPLEQCDAGLCNSSTKECDACVAGASSCEGGRVVECSTDGQTESTSSCGSSTPYCVGAGTCVQCTDQTECPSVGECQNRTCDNNTCSPIPKTINTPCSGGVCDGTGNCVECTSAAQCGADTDCSTPTCSGNSCGVSYETQGTTCTGGVCNGSGICVGCVNASSCSTSGECYTATCASSSCGQNPKPSGASCSGGVCNGNGSCVECVNTTQCPAPAQCYVATCGSGNCGSTPSGSGTSCPGGYCNGSGSCVECTTNAHCGGSTPYCVGGSCAECTPGQASQCASQCTRQVRTCSSSGSWQSGSACSGNAYCSGGSCITDTETIGWPLTSGNTRAVDGPIAQRFEIDCRSTVIYIGANFASTSGSVPMTIYAHDSATNSPGARIWPQLAGNIAADGSLTINIDGWQLDAGSYWIAMYPIGTKQVYTTGSGGGVFGQGTFDNYLVDPFVSDPDSYSGATAMYLVVRPSP